MKGVLIISHDHNHPTELIRRLHDSGITIVSKRSEADYILDLRTDEVPIFELTMPEEFPMPTLAKKSKSKKGRGNPRYH